MIGSLLPGSWRPAALTRGDLTRVIALITAAPLIRGMDYVLPPTNVGILERAAPLHLWAVLLWVGVGLLCVGAWCHRHALVWLGHGWLGTLYLGLTLSVLVDSALSLDGWRGALPLATIALLHWTFCLRTGPRPISEPGATDGVVVSDGHPHG